MKLEGTDDMTFILLSGITVPKSISLNENVELQPADTSHLDLMTAISACSHPDDIAVVAAFLPRITAQFKIAASTSEEQQAIIAWNTTWDALLLSAIFQTAVGFNLQSNTEASSISANSKLRATNYHMHDMNNKASRMLTTNELKWITSHFSNAKLLLDDDRFQSAIQCLASYRWHTIPRIKMAVLWAGIEGLFGASTEIRFRISLYIARFLHTDDVEARKVIFNMVKKLYNLRSSAVHGSKIKGNLNEAVEESADLLSKLIRQCIINKSIPIENDLVP